jgi:hypothetical protein
MTVARTTNMLGKVIIPCDLDWIVHDSHNSGTNLIAVETTDGESAQLPFPLYGGG